MNFNYNNIVIKVLFMGWLFNVAVAKALPYYKNYSDNDIISPTFKLAYTTSNSNIIDYTSFFTANGVSCGLGVNPLYKFGFLNNVFLTLDVDIVSSREYVNYNVLLILSYLYPIKLRVPFWVPDIYIFGGIGGGASNYKIKNKSNLPVYINSLNNVKLFNYGIELVPQKLKNTNISFFIENKYIYSNYEILHNEKKMYKQYKNTFVTIGLCYKIKYLINSEIN